MKDLDPSQIQRAKAGHASALSALIELYGRIVEGVVTEFLYAVGAFHGPAELEQIAQDIVQDFWEYMLRDERKVLQRYDPLRAKLSTYITMRAGYFCRDRYKRRYRHKHVSLPYDEAIAWEAVERVQELESRYVLVDLVRRLTDLIELTFPPRQRQMFHVITQEGLTHREAAARFGTTENAAGRAYNRARKRFDAMVEELEEAVRNEQRHDREPEDLPN